MDWLLFLTLTAQILIWIIVFGIAGAVVIYVFVSLGTSAILGALGTAAKKVTAATERIRERR